MIKPTDVAQSKLARDFVRRFQIGLQDGLLDVAPAFVASGVHIDRHQRFSLVNHDVAAALQPDLPMKCVVDLFLHAVSFENRSSTVIVANRGFRARREI